MFGITAPLLCAIAGVCALTATQYFLLAWRLWRPVAHLSFACLALSVAGFELATLVSYRAASVASYVEATRWLANFGCLCGISVTWFAAFYSGGKIGRTVWGLTALFGLLLLANQFSTTGLILRSGAELSVFSLPWGETIMRIRGAFNPWGYAYYGVFTVVAIYCLTAGKRVMRTGRRRRGLALSVGAAIMAIALASDVLMENGTLELLYFSDYAFLPLVFIMNGALVAELVASTERLRRLTTASFEGIFFTQDRLIVDVNEQLLRMFGFSREQLIGTTAINLMAPETHASVKEWVMSNSGRSLETVGLRRDGSRFPIEFRTGPHRLDGRPAFVTAVRDMSEWKAAMAALKASEEKYAKVFRNSPDAILVTRVDTGEIIETNERFTTVFGYPHNEVIGRTTSELRLWARAEDRTDLVKELKSQGFVREREFGFRRRDGEVRTALLSVELIEIQGESCMVAIVRDITARKQSELALRASEERFALAVRGSNDGIWDWDIKTNVVYYAPRYRELLGGYSLEEFPDVLGSISSRLHPEDNARVWSAVTAHLENHVPYDIEVRLQCRNGAYRWFRTRGQAIWDNAGQAVRMAGSLSDIHEHREAAEALQQSEAEFRAIFEGAAIGIALIGSDYRLLACNPALCKLLGYSSAELTGRPYGEKTLPEDLQRDLALYRDLLSAKRDSYQDEKRYIRKDGGIVWCRRTLSVVYNEGEPRCVVGMVEDISKRKQAEESLRLAHQRESQAHVEFTRRLLAAQEKERKRLATELHDSLGQYLSMIKNRTTLALEQSDVPLAARNHLDNIAQMVVQAIGEVRNLAHHLRPVHIEQFGLTNSLDSLIDQVAESTSIAIERRLENVDDVLNGDDATNIYRIVQEALNNLIKHSHATRASVSLERDLRCVRLSVEDNGCGFDVALQAQRSGEKSMVGLGLTSMRERVGMMDGTVEFQSSAMAGTRIRIELPISEPVTL